jgi:hypothetical protein
MPTVAIASEFLDAFARIPRAQQRKVREFTEKFRTNPKGPGINYERLIRDSGRLLDQEADQAPQQRLTSLSDVVDVLEESQIQGQLGRFPKSGDDPRISVA